MKIATKINLSFSAAAVALASFSLFALYTEAKTNLQEAIYAHLSTTAVSRARHVETHLEEDKARLWLLAESDQIGDSMREIIHNASNLKDSPRDLSAILKDYYEVEKEACELLILNPDGKVIASTDEGSVGADESTEVHFLKGKDRIYTRDAYRGKSGEQEYSISVPIRDDDAKTLLGVIVGRFEITKLNEILTDRTGLGETGEIYIVNKFGYMITPSRFTEDTFLKQEVNTVNFRMSVGRHEKAQTGHGPANIFPDYRGVSVLGSHAHISDMQWSLLAEIDEEEALMPMASLKYIFVVILCAVPVIVWIVGTVVSKAITSPLNKLQKGIETIGTGDLNIRFEIESNDEIGKLAQSFNEMAGKLKTIRDEAEGLNYQLVETTARANDTASQCKKTEAALQESEAKYRILYEDSRDAITMIALPTWKFVAGNQATLNLFGVQSEEEFITKGPWDVSPEYQPDGQLSSEKAKDMIEKAMKEGSNFFEWQHMTLNGKEFPATVLLTRIELGGEQLLQATVRDITEQQEQQYREESLVNLQQELIIQGDLISKSNLVTDALITMVNADFARIWLIENGDRCEDCSHADAEDEQHHCKYRDKCLHLVASSGRYTHIDGGHARVPFDCYKIGRIASGKEDRFLTNEVTVDPRVHNNEWAAELGLVSFAGYRLCDATGEAIGVMALFADHKIDPSTDAFLSVISQTVSQVIVAKRAEEAVKIAYEELEQAHSELKEMQSQLVQNEKLASIGQLAAGVAHEMNTPVGFVASNFRTLENYVNKFLELLAGYKEVAELVDTGTKEQRLAKLQEITELHSKMKMDFILEDIQGLFDDSKEGLDRVTGIVQNLRDFSRIDRLGSRDEYNINKGIEATLLVARNEIKYDADVKTDFSEVPLIFCHSGQINQVFLNILVNAAQAIKAQERDGNGAITIRTYTSEDKVICEIADDGPGIPPDKLSKIFDPFFTTKPAGKGTGLGLSVSYDIVVNKHNGELFAESTVGEGTKFTIKLPIGTKENDEQEIMSYGKENSVICG